MRLQTKYDPARTGIVLTAMLGALNDNLIKAAIIVFAALTAPPDLAASVGLMAGGLLVLPFVIFSGIAGAAADKYEKATLIRYVKYTELALAALATLAMVWANIPALLGVVFLMGTQSAFFGPLKLGWLPERLRPDQLNATNGWMETLTFLGILGGTVAGGLLSGPDTLIWAGIAAIVIALIGIVTAHTLPLGQPADPQGHVTLNPVAGGRLAMRSLWADRGARRAALLPSWFWSIGTVYLSTLPAHLRAVLSVDEVAVTLVMGLFALGIGSGVATAVHCLKGRISAALLLPATLMIMVTTLGVWIGFDHLPAATGMAGLLATGPGLFLCVCLFGVAFGGGLFAVPLKSLIQSRAAPEARARTMAGLGLLSSGMIFITSAVVALAVLAGLRTETVYLLVSVSTIGALIGVCRFFPQDALRSVARVIITRWCRVEVNGAQHLATQGPVVFIANHSSLLDGPLLQSLMVRDTAVAVNSIWAEGPILKRIAKLCNIHAIDPQNPMAAKNLAQMVQDGGAALVFPEGRVSTHGGLMKVYPGTAWMVDMADAPVVRITVEGAEASIFNRPITGLKRRWFPKVRVTVAAPQKLDISPELRGGARRTAATRAVQTMLETGRFEAMMQAPSIPDLYARNAQLLERGRMAITDPLGNTLSHRKLAVSAALFSGLLQSRTKPGERVGVLLPGVSAVAVILMGLWRAGRVPAILNPTLGAGPMLSAVETGTLTHILSSRDFIEKAELQEVVDHLVANGVRFIWTDDLKAEITPRMKFAALFRARRARDVALSCEDPAVVLFTSGTEGAPKGVVLSHGNLIGNIAQLRARTDFSSRDRILSAMPVFHSLGLTAGMLLPLVTGAPLMIYPSPLHYKIVPEMAYAHQATLIFGTDTFLSGWARKADAYDFSTVRAAIAGAEPVKQATREIWAQKFGVRILEGYGATEAGPVIALNTPMENRAGTVGRALTAIDIRLQDIPGLQGKRLWVHGPNVMAGYLLPGDHGKLTPVADGWYDTGDVVEIDEDGYIRIVGRAKRFAKIGGEMVSLTACEDLAAQCWPDARVGAVIMPDARKGERIVVVTDAPQATRDDLSAAAQRKGMAEIMVPAQVVVLTHVPLLASGKIDYPAVSAQLKEQIQAVA